MTSEMDLTDGDNNDALHFYNLHFFSGWRTYQRARLDEASMAPDEAITVRSRLRSKHFLG